MAHRYVAPRNATEEALCRIFADVLGIDRVGVDDDFFQLGGHSLLAIALVERARVERLHTDVRTLFANPTPARLSAAATQSHAAVIIPPNLIPIGCDAITPDMLTLAALSQSDIDRIVAAVLGGAANVQDIYPLAPLQEGILFHHLMATDGDPYLLPTLLAFDTHARVDAFLAALRAIVARHDILRTAVVWEGLPEPMQVVWRDATLIVEEVSLDAADGHVAEQLRQRFDPRGFRLDIRQAPMMRGFLSHDPAADRWLLLILSHHLASDHTTLEVVVEEARAYLLGESERLLAPLPFRDFVAQARLGVAREEHEAFFRSMLGDVSEPTAPFGLRDAQGDGSGVEYARLALDPSVARRLRDRARALGVSPASLCHQAFVQLLARASGRDDVVFGTVLFGRMHGGAGADRAVGLFINTLPLRVRLGVEGVAEAVRRTHERLTELLRHEHASLALAQRCSGVAAPAPLFSALLNYRHSPARQDTSDGSALAWEGLASLYSESRNNYPLTMSVDDFRDGFQLVAQTQSPLDPKRICSYMNIALEGLVEALEHSPQTPARTIDILPQDERHRLLVEWNDTATDDPQDRLLHELFEAQAARDPEAVALVYEGAQLSYGELNERANRLAHHLRTLGVGPDVIVGLCVERSFEMIVALLGALKAGGAYLPIDPDYPKDRIAYMIADAAPALVLTQEHLRERLPETITTLRLDADWSVVAQESAANPASRAASQNLAYVIYTSGSTGKPKGVAVIHSGVANYAQSIKGRIADRSGLRFALVSTPAADLGNTSLFASITSGGCLHLFAKETTADAHAMNAYLAQNSVDVIKITPSHYDALTQAREVAPAARHEVLVFGGEPLRAEMLERVVAGDGARRIYNHYGPTETTVGALMFPVFPAPAAGDPPIGRPLDNVQAYVVDATFTPVPIGVAGELHIGGAGLARGYLGRPDLTAERFVPNPFGAAGERLYRTGDLVRYRPDGNIDFLGRVDDQVKIRGFRIELGEIETALTRLPQLRAAVVLAREDKPGEWRLVAYVTAAEGAPLETAELRDALARELPDYMIPSIFVALDALPLTANGKIDRRALPAPEVDATRARGHVAPRNATEATLCRLFAEVLGVDRVGVEDDFFQLGGHSLLAIQLVARIKRHGLQTDVRTLFANPNPSGLAAAAGGAANVVVPPNLIPPGCDAITPDMLTLATLSQAEIERIVAGVPGGAANVQDIYPLAPLQEGILFHHLLATEGDPYLIQTLLTFDTRERVDAFLDALRAVIARHDILRTAIVWEALPEPMQLVWRDAPSVVEEFSLDAGDGDAAEQLRLRFDPRKLRLDVRQAPMLRGALAHDPATRRWLLLILSHHLALDHATRDIVVEEARAHLLGESGALVAPAPFRGFVAQTRSAASRAEHEIFFRSMLGDVTEPTAPFGLLDIVSDIASIGSARSRVEPDMARRLRERARAIGVSPASLFHLAFAQVLARASGRDDVVFGTVLFGRMHSGEGVERAVGLYMNTLPLRVRLGVEGAAEALRQLHVSLTELLQHEHASLALAQSCSGVVSPTPLFSALLNYRHSRPRRALSATRTALDEIGWLDAEEQRTNYPLGLSIDDLGDGFVLTAQTQSRLDPERICAYMNIALEGLVEALEHSPQTPVRTIDILPQDERHRLLVEWNDTAADYPQDRLLHELFEAQTARAPEAVALVYEGAQLSYGALNERANRLAHHLRTLGVGPDVIVGLCVERSFEMIVALLGVLKAGGAYLPIDPDYPRDRIAYMIADAAPALVLTQEHLRERLPETITTLRLDADWSVLAEESAANPAPRATSQNLAYVIYTSGSTGKPKGVGVTHHGVPNLAAAQRDCFEICDQSHVLQFANASFDASVSEVAMALTTGARLVLPQWDQRSGDGLAKILVEERITHVTLPPAVMPTLTPSSAFVLECLVVAGEACSAELTSRWASGRRLINAYGPTETTVCATLSGPLRPGEAPPIGRPIRSAQIYLVDGASEPVPTGVAGELYIGGAGLARGYLGRPDLTAERFVPNPFGEAGERLYRTGDLARYRANGDVEFLGRVDHQVKINGFRIELGEIEAALAHLPQIGESVVIAREDASGDKRLVAYSIATDGAALDVEELRMALAAELPDYMIPSAFVALAAFPLTANGKIDHSALPAPNFDSLIAVGYVGPRTVSEYVLAREFCAVLQLERIGIHDNFFRKGGHSLSGAKLVERIRRTLCSNLPVTAIFQVPTIAQLAEWITNFDRHAQSPLVEMRSAGTTAAVPLYCVHPGGGSIIRYQPFVDAMTGSRAVYGIQSRNLIDPSYVGASIEEMAKDYVDLIRRNQPRGPYMLLGWSSGGSFAIKMTEILEQLGETVAFLGLLDTAFSARNALVEDASSSTDEPRERRNAEAPRHHKPTALDYLAGFAKIEGIEIDDRLSSSDREHLNELSLRLEGKELYIYSAMWGQERGFWANISPELMDFLYTDRESSVQLAKGLVLNPVRAPIHIWWCSRSIERSGGVPCDWRELTSGAVETEIIAGDHESIVVDPLVHAQIIDVLDRLQA
ncbi:amino acid adenylation domain-containing protein [Methylocapsa aurea]|uniref:amino acid adenylation domain-containing protein n=1 Tax=Methylocapsa aurea TaxID=663610 RepID=UPI003D18D8E4